MPNSQTQTLSGGTIASICTCATQTPCIIAPARLACPLRFSSGSNHIHCMLTVTEHTTHVHLGILPEIAQPQQAKSDPYSHPTRPLLGPAHAPKHTSLRFCTITCTRASSSCSCSKMAALAAATQASTATPSAPANSCNRSVKGRPTPLNLTTHHLDCNDHRTPPPLTPLLLCANITLQACSCSPVLICPWQHTKPAQDSHSLPGDKITDKKTRSRPRWGVGFGCLNPRGGQALPHSLQVRRHNPTAQHLSPRITLARSGTTCTCSPACWYVHTPAHLPTTLPWLAAACTCACLIQMVCPATAGAQAGVPIAVSWICWPGRNSCNTDMLCPVPLSTPPDSQAHNTPAAEACQTDTKTPPLSRFHPKRACPVMQYKVQARS